MIPKVIYQTWKTQNLPIKVQKLRKKMYKLNSEYEYIIYTDEQMNDFISSNAPKEIKDAFFRINNIVAKADIWRYFILYTNGGLYLDIDSEITGRLDDLLTDDDTAIITAEKNKDMFVQWALIFDKGHRVLEKTIENILICIDQDMFKNDHHSLTVKTYAKAIFKISEEEGFKLKWDEINENTDKSYLSENVQYRIFGIDYNNYFRFKHKYNHLLRGTSRGEKDSDHWSSSDIKNNVYD